MPGRGAGEGMGVRGREDGTGPREASEGICLFFSLFSRSLPQFLSVPALANLDTLCTSEPTNFVYTALASGREAQEQAGHGLAAGEGRCRAFH